MSDARIAVVQKSGIAEGERDVKILGLSEDDVQTLPVVAPFGEDSSPPKGLRGLSIETGVRGEEALLGFLNKFASAVDGEKRIFSTDAEGSEVMAFIMLRTDGTMEFNGTGNFLTKFNEMETAFNTLKSDFDSLVTAYNAHIHVTTATVGLAPPVGTIGVIAPTTSTGTPSTADMSGAKAENLKTN